MDSTTLLIIGNGFDLHCGLKSSYGHFCEWLQDETDPNRQIDNIWTIHLLNKLNTGKNWIDVEAEIEHVLSISTGFFPEYKQWIDCIRIDLRNGPILPENATRESMYIFRSIFEHSPIIDTQSELEKRKAQQEQWLLDELKKLEGQFALFLWGEVKHNSNYTDRAENLMRKLDVDTNVTQVISFNYTNPFDTALYINVHGTLDDCNIIFGVDATAELKPEAQIFTKTYRKMMLKSHDAALPPNVSTIKFYGSSLGKADYSYFQSIFDFYNLYGDNVGVRSHYSTPVKLQFYYSIYDETKESEIRRDAINSVYELITAYGKTLDNKDKGKNLLHKLLLENRVQIECI